MDIEKADILSRAVDRLKGLYWLVDCLMVGENKSLSGLNDNEMYVVGQCLEMIIGGIAEDLETLEG